MSSLLKSSHLHILLFTHFLIFSFPHLHVSRFIFFFISVYPHLHISQFTTFPHFSFLHSLLSLSTPSLKVSRHMIFFLLYNVFHLYPSSLLHSIPRLFLSFFTFLASLRSLRCSVTLCCVAFLVNP